MKVPEIYNTFKQSKGVSTDTRENLEGKLFICLKGPNFDANSFAEEAIRKGARAVISDDIRNEKIQGVIIVEDGLKCLQELANFHRNTFQFPVIGLTGSNGKTTNKELIHAVLSEKYRTHATRGNLNNHIGVPLTLLATPADTEIVIIEMGANHQGEIRELSEICNPDFGLITNIGKAHLEGFGGLEGVKKGKRELFDHIKHKKGKVFVNGDDDVLVEISEGIERIIFGKSGSFYVHGSLEEITPTLSISYAQDNFISPVIKSQLVGKYNFTNLLAAICIGRYFDVNHNKIKNGLENYQPSNSRSQLEITSHNTLILDAYNANPSSMKLALENLLVMPGDKKLALLGQMLELGEETVIEHQALVDQLTSLGIDAILVGTYFKTCVNHDFPIFNNSEDLAKYLVEKKLSDFLVLIKGSRSVQMEKVIPSL